MSWETLVALLVTCILHRPDVDQCGRRPIIGSMSWVCWHVLAACARACVYKQDKGNPRDVTPV